MTEGRPTVELAESAIEAYRRGDVESFFALMDPEVEIFSDPEMPNSGTFHGHEGFARWTMEWLEAWETFELDPIGYEPVGECHALLNLRQHGIGKGSGIEVEMVVWYMAEFREGKAVRMHLYPTRERALEIAEAGEAGR
jgi:ketosteroid isomerase-like protein